MDFCWERNIPNFQMWNIAKILIKRRLVCFLEKMSFESILVLVKSSAMNETSARQVVDGIHIAPSFLGQVPCKQSR